MLNKKKTENVCTNSTKLLLSTKKNERVIDEILWIMQQRNKSDSKQGNKN